MDNNKKEFVDRELEIIKNLLEITAAMQRFTERVEALERRLKELEDDHESRVV